MDSSAKDDIKLEGDIVDNEFKVDGESKNPDVEMVKKLIEGRYQRLTTQNRRPSMEYLSPGEIFEVFKEYVDVSGMTNEDIEELYEKWYEDIYQPQVK